MRMLRGSADIQIRFKTGTEIPTFHPGDTLQAEVEIHPQDKINCRDVEISVGWHTEGKGDINRGSSFVDMLGVSELLPGMPITHVIEYTLPDTPRSFQGEILQIVWGVDVKIDIAMMPDINYSKPFVLALKEK